MYKLEPASVVMLDWTIVLRWEPFWLGATGILLFEVANHPLVLAAAVGR